jgi:hypothetical protein
MITRISPTPPVGAYPQLRLWDHLGKTPRSAMIKITIKIVPSIVSSALLLPNFSNFSNFFHFSNFSGEPIRKDCSTVSRAHPERLDPSGSQPPRRAHW